MGIKRRAFLFGSLAIAGAGVFGLKWSSHSAREEAIAATRRDGEGSFAAWLKIARDGTVTLYSPTIEMGQGSQTAQAQLIADELGVPFERIVVEQAPPLPGFAIAGVVEGFGAEFLGKAIEWVPQSVLDFGARQMPVQITGGSSAVRFTGALTLLRAAAGARQLLADEAASRLGVSADRLTLADGKVLDPASGRAIGYGELAEAAAERRLWSDPVPRPIKAGGAVGRDVPRLDLPGKVDGSAQFGIDVQVPDMRVATLVMAPVRGGKLESVDEAPAMALPGVEKVVRLPDAVVVVAKGYWAAWKGVLALSPQFSDGGHGALSSAGIQADHARLFAADKPEKVAGSGDVAKAFAEPGAHVISADYRVPYVHHAMMEPFAMTAHLKDGKLELWGGLQDPLATRQLAAEAAGIGFDAVTLHTTLLGGGFGRRFPAQCEIIAQVVEVAKACPWPVKLIWSREQEVQHGAYRTAASARLKAALKDGKITALQTDYAQGPNVEGEVGFLYQLPATARRHFAHTTNQIDGPLRSVNANQFAFWTESFMDELAAAAGEDPYRFRRKHLAEGSREARVLDEAARLSGWGTPLPPGQGRGIAIFRCFGTIVAEVVEAGLRADGYPQVHKVTAVVDCGTTVNPRNARAQVEGAILQGLSIAMAEEITLEKGAVVQSSFPDYPVLKLAEAPRAIAVHFVESGGPLGGIGEPGLPPLAPALVNALAVASGKRVRSLPIRDQARA